jgi:hypothetical protein
MTIGIRHKIGMALFVQHGCISVNETISMVGDKRPRDIIIEGNLEITNRIGLTEPCECSVHRNEKRYRLTQQGVDVWGSFFSENYLSSKDHFSNKGKSFKKRLENGLDFAFYWQSCKESHALVTDFKNNSKWN